MGTVNSFPLTTTTFSIAKESTDNAIVRFNGTTGGTQNSGVTVDDNDVMAGGKVLATDSTSARDLSDRFADIFNVKDFGAAADNTTDDTTAVAAAISAAFSAGKAVYFPAVCKITADIPHFHDVMKLGPGGVQVAGSKVFRAEPSTRNTSYSARQTIYVNSTSGTTGAGGLGPGAMAVKTNAEVVTILKKYGRLPGTWEIRYAAGEYTDKLALTGLGGSFAFYLTGEPTTAAWDNTSPPANGDATGASIPTTIFRPVLAERQTAIGFAIDIQNIGVTITDIQFRDWGDPANTDGLSGAIHAQFWAWVSLVNCHIWDCETGHIGREFSNVRAIGGIVQGCGRAGFYVGSSRYDYGANQTPGLSSAILIRRNTIGLDIWEGAGGHGDAAIYEDNGTHNLVNKGGVLKFGGSTFRNTGAYGPSIGVHAKDNAVISGVYYSTVWSGTHSPRIKMYNGAVNDEEIAYAPRLLIWNYADQTTSGTTALLAAGLPVKPGRFIEPPMAIIIKMHLSLMNTVSTVNVGLRNNGSFIIAATIPISAATYGCTVEMELVALTSATQRFYLRYVRSNTAATFGLIAAEYPADLTLDFNAAGDVLLQPYVQCANAGDSVVVKSVEISRRG